MSLTLVIGNRNYSSWSLRPWLAMKQAGLAFNEVRVLLNRPDTREQILRHSPSGRVPCLVDGALAVWDSMAICEYVNERYAGGGLWPRDVAQRARARSIAAEMHSGFAALRAHMSMDIRARYPDRGVVAAARPDVGADIVRIQSIWTDCLAASGGPFLFGGFSIADAFYAPVVTRFRTYAVTLPTGLSAYSDAVFALPAMQDWTTAAAAEPETLDD
ncbi:MAG: glutathione S-transferase family protein [Burkholderiaceae bacterium]